MIFILEIFTQTWINTISVYVFGTKISCTLNASGSFHQNLVGAWSFVLRNSAATFKIRNLEPLQASFSISDFANAKKGKRHPLSLFIRFTREDSQSLLVKLLRGRGRAALVSPPQTSVGLRTVSRSKFKQLNAYCKLFDRSGVYRTARRCQIVLRILGGKIDCYDDNFNFYVPTRI